MKAEIGGLAYAADPNDPDIALEAIAGGVVVWAGTVPTDEGSIEAYTVVRSYRGRLAIAHLTENEIVVTHPPSAARRTAGDAYTAIIRAIADAKAPHKTHKELLAYAMVALAVWAEFGPYAPDGG